MCQQEESSGFFSVFPICITPRKLFRNGVSDCFPIQSYPLHNCRNVNVEKSGSFVALIYETTHFSYSKLIAIQMKNVCEITGGNMSHVIFVVVNKKNNNIKSISDFKTFCSACYYIKNFKETNLNKFD